MGQPPIWQFNAVTYLGEKENLYLGYIKPDCVWHHRTELFGLFKNICDITGRTGKLEIPLEWFSKDDVIRELTTVGLEDLVWWCEKPDGETDFKPCGKCPPCKTVEAARVVLKKEKKTGEIGGITDLVDRELEKTEKKDEPVCKTKSEVSAVEPGPIKADNS